MTGDLERMLIEQREVEDRILRDLRECSKIQSDNIQTLVSWPDPPHNRPLPRALPAPLLPHRAPNSHRNCGMCSARSARI